MASLQKTLISQQVSSRDYSIILCSFQTRYALYISIFTDDGFTGLYAETLPNRCWGDDRIYYDDMQKCYSQIMRINVNTGSVSCITSDTEKGAYVVLDVFEGLLLGQYTNPAHPMKIVHKPPNYFMHSFAL